MEIPFSGPIADPPTPGYPAYDRAAAAALIPRMPALRQLIDALPGEGLTAFGKLAPGAEALERVRYEIDRLSAEGHKVSMIMADPNTLSGVAFRPGLPMCTQSTIKAIYIGALIESRPAALQENGQYMHDAAAYSDNESYHRLRQIYGPGPLLAWCGETGVDPGFAAPLYPRAYTAREMFKLWTRMYVFLNQNDKTGFGTYLTHSRASAAGEFLPWPVHAKAGWEHGLSEDEPYDPAAPIPPRFIDGDPSNDECAINDTGIVYTGRGPFLFVIYTDHLFGIFPNYTSPNPLRGLEEALCRLQEDWIKK